MLDVRCKGHQLQALKVAFEAERKRISEALEYLPYSVDVNYIKPGEDAASYEFIKDLKYQFKKIKEIIDGKPVFLGQSVYRTVESPSAPLVSSVYGLNVRVLETGGGKELPADPVQLTGERKLDADVNYEITKVSGGLISTELEFLTDVLNAQSTAQQIERYIPLEGTDLFFDSNQAVVKYKLSFMLDNILSPQFYIYLNGDFANHPNQSYEVCLDFENEVTRVVNWDFSTEKIIKSDITFLLQSHFCHVRNEVPGMLAFLEEEVGRQSSRIRS